MGEINYVGHFFFFLKVFHLFLMESSSITFSELKMQ